MRQDLLAGVTGGDAAAVVAALDSGADIDAADQRNQTALMLAATRGHATVVQLLINRGAELDRAGKYGLTALMLAVVSRHGEIATMLLDAGADPLRRGSGAPGFQDRTAFDLALASGQMQLAAHIRDRFDKTASGPHAR